MMGVLLRTACCLVQQPDASLLWIPSITVCYSWLELVVLCRMLAVESGAPGNPLILLAPLSGGLWQG
jgi:hypothetical protein